MAPAALALVVTLALGAQAGTPSTPHALLGDALVCKGDVTEAVRSLAEGGSRFAGGYAAYSFGTGMQDRSIVILDEPLTLAGSTTHAVISEPSNSYNGFQAFTYARFRGDWRAAVEALGLKPEAPGAEVPLGQYVAPRGEDEICPATIILSVDPDMPEGEFLLGCGWCNG